MSASLNLTFGVEFEFIVRWSYTAYRKQLIEEEEDLLSGTLSSSPSDFIKEHICTALTTANLPVNPVYFDFETVLNPYASWTIKDDISIFPQRDLPGCQPENEDALYIGVELTSRILPATGAGLGEVLEVLGLLGRSFNIKVNDTCGYHVHIGNRNNGFPVPTVRRLAQLVIAFEHQIESIHPNSRIGNDYCLSPSANILRDHESPFEGIRKLSQECTSTWDINRQISPIKSSAYNLNNLFNSSRTIEFRQHAGTVNGHAALSWAVLCIEMVRFCHFVPQTLFDELLVKHGTDDGFRIKDFIGAVVRDGIESLTKFYGEERLFKRERRRIKEPWPEASPIEEGEEEERWEIVDSYEDEEWRLT